MQTIRPGLALLWASFAIGCTDPGAAQETTQQPRAQASEALDVEALARNLDVPGTEQDGQYKVSVAQDDLVVTVDGFEIVPPMGMGSWAAFAPAGAGAVVMGDVVVQEDEIGPVQEVLIQNGLTVTGLHNHFVRENPDVMYMHIGGSGAETELARGVQAAFDRVAELRGGDPSSAPARTVENTLDTSRIDEILGHTGEMNRGVYKLTIGRPDVRLTSGSARVTTFMGFNTWAAWQGTPDDAAVAGDFTMLESEVAPVIEALVENGIEVVAVHNHMVHEQPRVFFLHYWGTGPAETLARGLRAALDETGGGTTAARWTFDDVAAGSLPAGWRNEATNPRGDGALWSVQPDPASSDGQALALTDTRGAGRGTFNLLWTDRVAFGDGRIELRVNAGTGEVDQGGGPIWRVQDKDNYYIARWNPLEDNFRLYYVEDGDRRQLASADTNASAGEWHTIAIEHEGNRIEGYLDGEPMFETTDDTFADAGGIGVWTKADAATRFDDVSVTPVQAE